MRRSLSNTVYRTPGSMASWLNFSEPTAPLIGRHLTWFEVLGYTVLLQPDIVSGRHQSILQNYSHGILGDRFRQAMQRINPTVSADQIEAVFRHLTAPRTLPLLQRNRQWHLQLLNGIPVDSQADSCGTTTLQLIDCLNLNHNDWLVIHSFPVIEGDYQHCLDLVVFINGLPLAVFHGLHAGEEAWSLRSAYFQLQRYKAHLPQFFSLNELLVLANGVQARIGTLSTSWKQFMPIQSVNGEEAPFPGETEVEILIQGVFDKRRLFEMIQHFIVFHQSRTQLTKRLRTHSFCTISRACS